MAYMHKLVFLQCVMRFSLGLRNEDFRICLRAKPWLWRIVSRNACVFRTGMCRLSNSLAYGALAVQDWVTCNTDSEEAAKLRVSDPLRARGD